MTTYVIDHHPLMCQSISILLRRADPTKKIIEVFAYSKLQEALLINGQPKLFIMEPLSFGISGTSEIKKIKENYPNTPLIFISSIPSTEAKITCIDVGVDLYIEKTTPIKDTFNLIRNYFEKSQNTNFQAADQDTTRELIKLSKRQKQLLVLVDSGLSNEDTAAKLNISAHTVKVHLWRLYKKLGIHSRTQLIKLARDNGYL